MSTVKTKKYANIVRTKQKLSTVETGKIHINSKNKRIYQQ